MSTDDTNANQHAPTGLDDVANPDDRDVERGRAFATMSALQHGREPPDLDANQAKQVGQFLYANGMAYDNPQEAALARQNSLDVGQTHDGERDINRVLGYPDHTEVGPDYYWQLYRECDPATAIVDKPVRTTWRNTPVVTDSPDEGTADTGAEPENTDPSDFEAAVQELFGTDHLQRGLPYYWERADRNCRALQFSLLYFGFDDGQDASEPVAEANLSEPGDLRFVRPVKQTEVVDWRLSQSADDDREPGLPLYYKIETENPQPDGTIKTDASWVHYSRIIHVTDDPDATRLLSRPATEPVLHRLLDYQKVVGASAEMFWVGADRKFFFKRDSDSKDVGGVSGNGFAPGGGGDAADFTELDAQLRAMMHGQKPGLYADNLEMQTIDGQQIDPGGIVDVLYQAFAAVTNIPKRILTGSERGELASSQDAANWYGRIDERQTQYAEPVLVRGTLDLLITYGILPDPDGWNTDETGPAYVVRWPSLFEQDDQDVANTRALNAQAVKRIENAASVTPLPRKFLYEEVLGVEIPDDLEAQFEDPALDTPQQPQDGTGQPDSEAQSPDGPESPSPDAESGDTDGQGDDSDGEQVAENTAGDMSPHEREQFEAMRDEYHA